MGDVRPARDFWAESQRRLMHAPLAPPLSSKRGKTNLIMRSQELVECTYISKGLLQDAEIWQLERFLIFSLPIIFTLIQFNKKFKIQYALIGAVLSDKSFLQR
jgi:hypothetical protein